MKTIISALITCFLAITLSAEERTFLGAETVKTSNELKSQLGLEDNIGHTVKKIHKDSPAEKSGLKVNDIIYSINDKNIKNFIKLNQYIWASFTKGEEIKIDFYREGKKESVKAVLSNKDYKPSDNQTAQNAQANQQKAVQDIMKQLQSGGLQNLLKNGGSGISTMMVDGEHRIAVSGAGKGKHVKVTNTNTNEVEFEGDIVDGDFSDVPSDLRPKVERAVNMIGGINFGGTGGKGTPKAKDDSAEKVDDFIKEIEKEKAEKASAEKKEDVQETK